MKFDEEPEWQGMRTDLLQALLLVGRYCGDSERSCALKTDCALRLAQHILEDVPDLDLTVHMPDDLCPRQGANFLMP